MSRTRHHEKTVEGSRQKKSRKSFSIRQRYAESMKVSDWYIELPVSKHISNRILSQ